MRRFFARICADEVDALNVYAETTVGIDEISFYGEPRSYTGTEPWDFYFSSGIIEDDHFEDLETYISALHDCIFVRWDGEHWEEITGYYDGLLCAPLDVP